MCDEVREITLTQDKMALVCMCDHESVSRHKWQHGNHGYAVCHVRRADGGWTKRTMQGLIMGPDPGYGVDHINGNRLDNRRPNLRLATQTENMRNTRKYRNNKSGYKGVSWDKQRLRWVARIKGNNKQLHVGYFDTALDAAMAYDLFALYCHGEFASVNFPVAA